MNNEKTEQLRELEEVFAEAQDIESIAPSDAMALLGAVIRKCATDETLDKDQVKAMMQRAYLIAESVQKWASDEDAEVVSIPQNLLSVVKKDAEGDALMISISQAMRAIAKTFEGGHEGGHEREATTKGDDAVAWGYDLNLDSDDDRVEWGADPEGIR